MSEKHKHTILVVDDEEGILKALKRLFQSLDVDTITATSGQEALDALKLRQAALIISDQRMPGMSGVEFLSRSRALAPDSIRILLTGYADIETTIDAINRGSVEYYFNKPWDEELFLSRIRESLNMYDVLTENRRLTDQIRIQNDELKKLNETLEQRVQEQTFKIKEQHEALSHSFMETIKAFSTMVELRSKEVGSHSQRVTKLIRKMIEGLDLNEKEHNDIIIATFLHDIGKIGVPDKLLNKNPTEYTNAEKELIKKHVVLGQSCVFGISGFEEIGLIIRHHHENYNGSGYPDKLKEKRIPLGSRLIRVVDAFDRHAFLKGYPNIRFVNDATALLVQHTGIKYDPDLVKRFIGLDIGKMFLLKDESEIVEIKPHNLEPDMVVAADVYTRNGMFLLPKGAKLSSGMIKRLVNINKYDAIDKGVFVFLPVKEEKRVEQYA